MNLDIKKAFLSPFSERKWYVKLIFPIIMTFLISLNNHKLLHLSHPYNAIIGIISFTSFLLLAGFYIQFQHNEIRNEFHLLPGLKFKVSQYFEYGFFSTFIIFFYVVPIFLLSIIPQTVASIAMLILRFSHLASVLNMLITSISVLVGVFILLIDMFLLIACIFALNAYADDLKMNINVNFKETFKFMSKVKAEVFIYALIAIPLDAITVFMTTFFIHIPILLIRSNLIFIIAPIFITFMQLMKFNLGAQLYKVAKSK